MYEVRFTINSKDSIFNFIDNYRNGFIKRYSNTGLDVEEVIKAYYINDSIRLKENIFDYIKYSLEHNKVLGYSILENNNFEITTIVGNYRLFIEYFEDNDEKLRFVENIKFFYK